PPGAGDQPAGGVAQCAGQGGSGRAGGGGAERGWKASTIVTPTTRAVVPPRAPSPPSRGRSAIAPATTRGSRPLPSGPPPDRLRKRGRAWPTSTNRPSPLALRSTQT